jgi:hypothetical protein
MNSTDPAVFEAVPEVLSTDLGNEMVLIEGSTGATFRLNSSARHLWLALPASGQELAQQLIAAYGVAADRAERDTAQTLETLQTRGLCRRRT